MKTQLLSIVLSASTLTYADMLILKTGQHMEGTYLGGDARTVKFDAADHISTYQVSDVEDVHFGSSGATTTAVAPAPQAAPWQRMLQIYADTPLVVRLIDPIKSDEAHAGATYRASLDTPI